MEIKPEELGRESLRQKLEAIKQDEHIPILARLLRGETVNIQDNEDFYYTVNKNLVPLKEFVERNRFQGAAKSASTIRDLSRDQKGFTDGKTMRLIGQIPAEIFFKRAEFDHNLPREERDKNVTEFLNEYPAFKTVDAI